MRVVGGIAAWGLLAFATGWIATYLAFIFAWGFGHATTDGAMYAYMSGMFAVLVFWLVLVVWLAFRLLRWVRKGAVAKDPRA